MENLPWPLLNTSHNLRTDKTEQQQNATLTNIVQIYQFIFSYSDGGGLVAKSCLTLATPRTVVCQVPLSMGFSRQEYWSGLPFPSPGEFSWPRDQTQVSCIAGRYLMVWITREVPLLISNWGPLTDLLKLGILDSAEIILTFSCSAALFQMLLKRSEP